MCRSLLTQRLNGLLYSNSLRQLESRALQPLLRRGASKRIQPKKETEDPIAQRLYETLYKKARKRTGDRNRVHVLSSKLCDDVIERLAQSLEKHKGCDIIDISPGLCVWSAKLHEHLKPRTHLLLEHEGHIYEEFYKPLLEKEGSTYKLIPKNGLLWDTLHSLPHYLPNQKPLSDTDPQLHTPNNTLLFVGNLGRIPPSASSAKSIAHLFMYQLMAGCRNHSNFQRYGLIRMLLWVEDKEKMVVLPRFVCDRTKYTVETEITCENIVEVASHDVVSNRAREYSLELSRAKEVAKKMESTGIKTPEGRAGALGLEAIRQLKEPSSEETPPSKGVVRPFMEELQDLQSRFDSGELSDRETDPDAKLNFFGRPSYTAAYERLQKLKWRLSGEEKEYQRLNQDIAQYMSIMAKEDNLKNLSNKEAQESKAEIEKLWEEFHAALNKYHHNYRDQVSLRLDDRRIFNQNPPGLLWDRRPYEPLKVEEQEFYPPIPLTLIDFQPKAIAPALRDLSNYDHFEFILGLFWMIPKQSVKEAMESLAPGAFSGLIKDCPSLTDPAKGGSSNIDLLKVRSMTQQQFVEILEAWLKWPFKPDDEKILARTGGSTDFENSQMRDLELETSGTSTMRTY